MIDVVVWITIFCATVVAMEVTAALTHKHLMHGGLWFLHRSHHEPRTGRFEKNDLFAVFFAVPSIVLIHIGTSGRPMALAVGLGMAMYGLLYALLHDGLAHRRFPLPRRLRNRYLRRLVRAHRLHHATRGKDGAVSFGFLYAKPIVQLAREYARGRSR